MGNPTNLAFVPGLFAGLPSKMNFWQRLMNVVLFNEINFQFNYYSTKQKRYIDESFGAGYPSIYELSREFDLVFINSHYSLNGVKPMTHAIVEVGGLHINDDDDAQDNLIPVCIYIKQFFRNCKLFLQLLVIKKLLKNYFSYFFYGKNHFLAIGNYFYGENNFNQNN